MPAFNDGGAKDVRVSFVWRMKNPTHRAKDALDPLFLEQWFAARGEELLAC